jgi:hypothetical protein
VLVTYLQKPHRRMLHNCDKAQACSASSQQIQQHCTAAHADNSHAVKAGSVVGPVSEVGNMSNCTQKGCPSIQHQTTAGRVACCTIVLLNLQSSSHTSQRPSCCHSRGCTNMIMLAAGSAQGQCSPHKYRRPQCVKCAPCHKHVQVRGWWRLCTTMSWPRVVPAVLAWPKPDHNHARSETVA